MTISSITYGVSGNSVEVAIATGRAVCVAGQAKGQEWASLDAACVALDDDARDVIAQRYTVEGRTDGKATDADERDALAIELARHGYAVALPPETHLIVVNGTERLWRGVASPFALGALL